MRSHSESRGNGQSLLSRVRSLAGRSGPSHRQSRRATLDSHIPVADRRPARSFRRALSSIAATAVAVTGLMAGPIAPALAESNPAGLLMRFDHAFSVYAEAGETVDVNFTVIAHRAGSGSAVVTIQRPGAAPLTCSLITATSPAGTACDWDNLAVATSGIWSVTYDSPGSGGGATVSWDISVKDAGTPVPGRVWTEQYGAVTPAGTFSFSLWYQSEFGDQYKSTYRDYNGVDSVFVADRTGLREPGTCEAVYESGQQSGPLADPYTTASPGECGDPYKIFFAAPSADLPVSATRWDGASDWILPPVVEPTIGAGTFAPANNTDQSGSLQFTSTNFVGNMNILVDANNDGDFTDAVDRNIPYYSAGGANTFAFDGLNGLGELIPSTQPISFRALADRTGEIHFVNTDVEIRAGGIEVIAQRGPSAGNSTLYWNDTPLVGEGNRCSTTPVPDGTAGIDSTGGVHAWANCVGSNANDGINGSWGDTRHINDWTYRPINALVDVSVAARGNVAIDKTVTGTTYQGQGNWLVNYEIGVTNLASVPSEYSLTDQFQFGAGYTVVSAPVTTNTAPAGITTNAAFDGATDQRIAPAGGADPLVPIAASATHTYTVAVTVNAPGTSSIEAGDCTLGAGETGTGFRNEAAATGAAGDTVSAVDCASPTRPVVTQTKDVIGVPSQDAATGDWFINYRITETATGDGATSYTLTDALAYGAGITVISAVASADPSSGAPDPSLTWNGASDTTLVTDAEIFGGSTHSYVVAVRTTLPAGTATTPAAANCELEAGETGTGFLNTATVSQQGAEDEIDSACAEPAAVSITKAVVGTPAANADGTTTINYDITVTNAGPGNAEYDLDDSLHFGAGITVKSATATNTSPGNIATNTGWNGISTSLIAENVVSEGSSDGTPVTHVYRVTVIATVPPELSTPASDCTMDAGESGTGFLNTATLTSDRGNGAADACADALPPAPGQTLVKTADSSAVTSPAVAGQTITYTFTSQNTGNVTLTGVVIEDQLAGLSPLTYTWPGTAGTLLPGQTVTATATYAITQADIDAGHIANTALAKGADPTGTERETPPSPTDTPLPPAPGQTLVKTADSSAVTNPAVAGQTITYNFTSQNTGNVTLTGVLIEDQLAGLSPLTYTWPGTAGTLLPGQTVTATATYAITQADIDAGHIANTALAKGTDPAGNENETPESPTDTLLDRTPGISLEKSADKAELVAGETIAYTLVSVNTGNVTLTGVAINDAMAGLSPLVYTWPGTAGTLLPGQSVTATATYVVSQADVDAGTVSNTATVTSTPPTGPAVTATDTVQVPENPEPAQSITKTADYSAVGNPAQVGDIITYSFTSQNTGNVTLTTVSVEDQLQGLSPLVYTWPGTAGTLLPGQTVTATATYAITQADIDAGQVINSALAAGETAGGIRSRPPRAAVAIVELPPVPVVTVPATPPATVPPAPLADSGSLAYTGAWLIGLPMGLLLLLGGGIFLLGVKRRHHSH
ncbi:DUF11 domain-containing protein [Arthrobacter sp. R1-13]